MFSGSFHWVHRAGGTGIVEQWGHHLAHKPRSGLHVLAWAVTYTVFPMVLGRGKKIRLLEVAKQPFSTVPTNSGAACMLSKWHARDFPGSWILIIWQKNSSHHYLTALWGRRTPCAITQADGRANPPQLKARITTESDACPRVMKQTLCGAMGGHWRPVASNHWVEIVAFYSWTHVVLFSSTSTECWILKM